MEAFGHQVHSRRSSSMSTLYEAIFSAADCVKRTVWAAGQYCGDAAPIALIKIRAAAFRVQSAIARLSSCPEAIRRFFTFRRIFIMTAGTAAAFILVIAPTGAASRYAESLSGLSASLSKSILVIPVDSVIPADPVIPVGSTVADCPENDFPVEKGYVHLPDVLPYISGCEYRWPAQGEITSTFGYRRASVGSTNHKGLDIGGSYGQSIFAADEGEVIVSEWSNSYGYVVRIMHTNGHITLYCHCSSLLVRAGDTVAQGQEIARMGATGMASGTHLHFELIIDGVNVDPLLYLPEI